MRKLTIGLVALLTATALAACDSGGSTATRVGGGKSLDPTEIAKSIQALGAIDTRGSGTASGPVQPIRTSIDYRNLTMLGQFPPGVPTKPVRVVYRAKGDLAWFSRRVATGQGQIGIGPDLLILRPPGVVPWVQVPRTTYYANLVMRPWDPVFLLTDLAAMPAKLGPAVRFRPSAPATIGGVQRPGYTAKTTPRQGGYIGIRRVTLWTDKRGVPVRIRIETPTLTRGTYDITRRRAPVVVQPPPGSQIEKANKPLPSASGAYVEAASGTAGSVPYRVLRAPATDGGSCWKVESNPAYSPQDEPRPDGGVCIPPITTKGDPLDQVGFPIDATGDTPYEMFGLLVPTGSTVEAIFFDGSRRAIPLDPSGLALVVGPEQPALGAVQVKLPDGVKLDCGPGSINTPADINDSSAVEARSAPWNCLPADAIEG